MFKQRYLLLLLVLFVIYAAWIAIIHLYGVNIPILDQWVTPGEQIESFFENHLNFAQLVRQHNESRMLFPTITFLALATFLKEWNIKAEMLLGLGFSFLMLLTIYVLLLLTNKSFAKNICIITIYNLLLLCPCSFSRWLRGITIHRLIPDACMVANALIFRLGINSRLKILLYSTFCMISQYSFSGGIVTWIISLLFVFYQKNNYRRERFQNVILYSIFFITSSLFYFKEYTQPSDIPIPSKVLSFSFQNIIVYFLSFLGNIFGDSYEKSAVIGLFLIVSFVVIVLVHLIYVREREIISWMGLGFYTIGLGVLNSVTRLQVSYINATRIDYIVHLVYLPLSVIAMFLYLIKSEKDKIQKWAFISFIVAISILYVNKNFQTNILDDLQKWDTKYSYGRSCIQLISFYKKDDCIKLLFPVVDPPSKWRLEYITQRFHELSKLNVLKPGLVKKIEISPPDEWGYVDFLKEESTDERFRIYGWAKIENKAADAVLLSYQNKIIDILSTGEIRDDISQKYGWRYRTSGWSGNFIVKNKSSQFNKCDIKAYGFDANKNILYPLKNPCL